MIVDIEGKRIAFGMRWEALVNSTPQKLAKQRKAQMMWYDKSVSAINIGFLHDEVVAPKARKDIHAGAMEVARQFHEYPNTLMICSMPGKEPVVDNATPIPPERRWIVCGIYDGVPHREYDAVDVSSKDVGQFFDNFTKICGEKEFHLVGNIGYPGITPYDLKTLADHATNASLLKGVSTFSFDPKKLIAGVVTVGAVSYATYFYLDYQKTQKMLEQSNAERSAQDIYSEVIARKRNAGSLPAGSATALIDWIRKQNINVGGWKLKKISCNVQENNRVVCSSDYQRGPLTLATNESFLQNSPVPKENVSFDISGVQIHTAIAITQGLSFEKLGNAMDAAKTQRIQVVDFGSKLQQLTLFGETKLSDFAAFSLPPGVSASQIPTALRTATWSIKGPLRVAESFESFPKSAVIQNITVTIENLVSDYSVGNSFVRIDVTGQIFST